MAERWDNAKRRIVVVARVGVAGAAALASLHGGEKVVRGWLDERSIGPKLGQLSDANAKMGDGTQNLVFHTGETRYVVGVPYATGSVDEKPDTAIDDLIGADDSLFKAGEDEIAKELKGEIAAIAQEPRPSVTHYGAIRNRIAETGAKIGPKILELRKRRADKEGLKSLGKKEAAGGPFAALAIFGIWKGIAFWKRGKANSKQENNSDEADATTQVQVSSEDPRRRRGLIARFNDFTEPSRFNVNRPSEEPARPAVDVEVFS